MKLASLWIGDRLGPIEILSAQSFLAAGNDLTIFAYGPLADVPEGVEVRDAEPILSGEFIARYGDTGWPSHHSNLFRYALLQKGGPLWVDLDLIALGEMHFDTPHVFAYEVPPTIVNGAVLGLPKDSPALAALAELRPTTVGFPPDVRWDKRLWMSLVSGGKGVPIGTWPHTTTGPRALTHHLKATGEITRALPMETFYPFAWNEVDRFTTPGRLRPSDIPKACVALHLWGFHIKRRIRRRHGGKIPPDSYLGSVRRELGPAKLRDVVPA